MKCVRSALRSLWRESSGEPGPVFYFNLKRFESSYLPGINTAIQGKLRKKNKYIHVKNYIHEVLQERCGRDGFEQSGDSRGKKTVL